MWSILTVPLSRKKMLRAGRRGNTWDSFLFSGSFIDLRTDLAQKQPEEDIWQIAPEDKAAVDQIGGKDRTAGGDQNGEQQAFFFIIADREARAAL